MPSNHNLTQIFLLNPNNFPQSQANSKLSKWQKLRQNLIQTHNITELL